MRMRIRFRSSAGATRSQRTFGTTPNIAPPSSFCPPAWIACTLHFPTIRLSISGDVAGLLTRRTPR